MHIKDNLCLHKDRSGKQLITKKYIFWLKKKQYKYNQSFQMYTKQIANIRSKSTNRTNSLWMTRKMDKKLATDWWKKHSCTANSRKYVYEKEGGGIMASVCYAAICNFVKSYKVRKFCEHNDVTMVTYTPCFHRTFS